MISESLTRPHFETLQKKLFALLKPKEHLFLTLAGESSQFIRINSAKIRQIGTVTDATLTLTLVYESAPGALHKSIRALTLSGIAHLDQGEITSALQATQKEVRELPPDPYAQLPVNHGQSAVDHRGKLPSIEDAPLALMKPSEGLDIAGIYSAGPCIRAMADSSGTFHWFSSDTFCFDYSIYTPGSRAVKGMVAGRTWEPKLLENQIATAREKLELLTKPARRLDRGSYRVYLEPAAFSNLVHMLSWGAVGEGSIRQGDSPLQRLRSGRYRMSPLFSLNEDFRGGESPRFNDEGELAPDSLALFDQGEFKNSLVSTRTAKEYSLSSNFASSTESLRAPSVVAGSLAETEILRRLDTGLYLSNLHYLNWSDQNGGRITGMTRYACFWVENGKRVCPIENMRFDDTIFRLFGDSLEALTENRSYLSDTHSYGMRSIGGSWMPGALLKDMKFTL